MYLLTSIILAEDPNGVHLAGDIKEVFWGSAAFFVLLGLIIWKAGPKIKELMNARTESIRSELADAEMQRVEAQQALETSAVDLPDVGKERSRIRKEAIESAEKLKVDLNSKAIEEAKAIMAKGKADCENLKRQANADMANEVARLTRETTEAVVINDIDSATHSELIDSYINKVGQLA